MEIDGKTIIAVVLVGLLFFFVLQAVQAGNDSGATGAATGVAKTGGTPRTASAPVSQKSIDSLPRMVGGC